MTISHLRILPPFAIARFGSSQQPLEAYDLEISPDAPLDYRQIVPRETFEVDPASGAIARRYTPDHIVFRDDERIRPVAPFLEVFACIDDQMLEPLTLDLLQREGIASEAVVWTASVANLKVFR